MLIPEAVRRDDECKGAVQKGRAIHTRFSFSSESSSSISYENPRVASAYKGFLLCCVSTLREHNYLNAHRARSIPISTSMINSNHRIIYHPTPSVGKQATYLTAVLTAAIIDATVSRQRR